MKKQFVLIAFILTLILVASNFARNLPTIPLYLEVPIAPMPVKADGKTHLLYELHITSFRRTSVELVQLDVFNDEISSKPLASFKDAKLVGMIQYTGINKKGDSFFASNAG